MNGGAYHLRAGAAARCWKRMPAGCAKGLQETGEPREWFRDPLGDPSAAGCNQRTATFNSYCEKGDAESHWGLRPSQCWKRMPTGCNQHAAAAFLLQRGG